MYLPDYRDGELPERDYLFNIISTKYPKSLRELIEHARTQRAQQDLKDDEELIFISSEIKKEIMSVVSQKGKHSLLSISKLQKEKRSSC